MKVRIGDRDYSSWKAAAEAHGVSHGTFVARVWQRGWTKERAATTPVREAETFVLDGVTATIAEHASRLGVKQGSLRYRLRNSKSRRVQPAIIADAMDQLPSKIEEALAKVPNNARIRAIHVFIDYDPPLVVAA
jgi:hypothetical protein